MDILEGKSGMKVLRLCDRTRGSNRPESSVCTKVRGAERRDKAVKFGRRVPCATHNRELAANMEKRKTMCGVQEHNKDGK